MPRRGDRDPAARGGDAAGMNDPVIVTGLRDGPLDVVSLIKQIWRTDCGAVVTFEGTTRSPSEGRDVERLEYEAYEERASTQLRALAEEAVERFGLGGVVAVHRIGVVPVGEPSVVVGCAAAHRGEAFEGARWLIDRIKADAAIWKKEIFAGGERWVGVDG
ncbi:MAG: molybdenum cofactor biosynthesis protein MoaE [Actinobacteria bacterium]|nr:MAG: molybdenum cofactor biosynthesis protein MoaE [Actinomycetota bacterium]